MKNPFGFLRQAVSPHYLGIDIGTTSIKAIEVDEGSRMPRLINYAILESQASLTRANSVFQTSTLKLFDEEIAELLKLMLKKMNPGTAEVVASLPAFAAFVTVLNFPEMNDADLAQAMSFQAKQYIPLPLSEVAVDWVRVGKYKDDQGFSFDQVMLISVPQEQIRKYKKVFADAGLKLRVLEIEPLALARSLVGPDPTPTFVVDIGSRSTTIAVIDKGQMVFSAQSDFAGASLTQALAESLNINPLRAEELKRERGIAGTGPNYELSTIMLPFLDAIMNEVRRAQYNYMNQFPGAPNIQRVILSGGGANLLGIEKYWTEQFGIPAVKGNPFGRCEYPAQFELLSGELNPLLAVSAGLALREFT